MNIEFDVGSAKPNEFGELFYPLANGAAFDEHASETVFSRYLGDTFSAESTLYIIVGSDSGLLPFYIEKEFKDNRHGRKFIFIDYGSTSKDVDFSTLPAWIECYPAGFSLGLLSQTEVEFMAYRKINLVKSISVMDAKNGSPYEQIWTHFEQEYSTLLFAENVGSVTRSFVDAQLLNVHRNINPINSIKKALKNQRVILVGGGPSFDDDIEWIKKNQEHCIIVASARMASKMMEESILPDFYVSVDPNDVSFDNSKKMLFAHKDCVLLNCFHISPKLLNQWGNNSVYFGDPLPWGGTTNNSSSPGPTVMHSALHQVVFLGAKEVYLTGVDLCFRGGKTHASGNVEDDFDNRIGMKNIKYVETYAGNMAETDQAFSAGVSTLEYLVNSYREYAPACKIYNFSRDAAKVEGILHKDASTVQMDNAPASKPVMAFINKKLTRTEKEYQAFFKVQLVALQKQRTSLRKAIKHAETGLKRVDTYVDSQSNASQIIKIRNKLDKQLGEMGQTIYHYGIHYFKDAFKPLDDENNMSEEEVVLTLKTYFKAMKKSIGDFIAQLDKGVVVLQNRKLEFLSTSKPATVFFQWKKSFELGRYRIWEQFHPNSVLSALDKEALSTAKEWFERNVNNKHTAHTTFLKKRSLSVKDLHAKSMSSFNKNDTQTLLDVQKQLTLIKTSESEQLTCLTDGMLHDIDNKPGQAALSYEKVTLKPMMPFTLKRLLSFAMANKNHEQVLINLEKLCEFSLDYMLPYADYLVILGQHEFAKTVLDSFIVQFPDNVVAKIKLVDVEIKLGNPEGALTSLLSADKIAPNNPQVMAMKKKFS